MTSTINKIVSSALILGILSFSLGGVESNPAEKYGDTSFNDGVGKVGSDQKVLTKNDVAVNYTYRYLLKGTSVLATTTNSHVKRTLNKWGYGYFAEVIFK